MEFETALQIIEAINAIKGLFDKNSDGSFDGELLPQEVTDLLVSLSDGEQGNNDIETLLVEIKDTLMYDDEYTALSEISSRLPTLLSLYQLVWTSLKNLKPLLSADLLLKK